MVGLSIALFRTLVPGAFGAEGGGTAGVRRKGGSRRGDSQSGERDVSVEVGDRRPGVDRRRGVGAEFGKGGDRLERVHLAAGVSLHRQP